jgi:hypothetical protein
MPINPGGIQRIDPRRSLVQAEPRIFDRTSVQKVTRLETDGLIDRNSFYREEMISVCSL